MATLPTELITEVLTRLPVKSLIKFTCVCKSWYSLIKSPKFIKLHLNQTLISNSNRFLLISYSSIQSSNNNLLRNHLVLSEFDTNPNGNQLKYSEIHHPLNHRELTLLGDCNGVVCISDKPKNNVFNVFLYNPLTKSCRKLPRNRTSKNNPNNKQSFVFGFGYDAETDDYKVLRLLQDNHYNEVNYKEAELYSMRSNSWKYVEKIPYFLLFFDRHGVYLNGAIHFVVVTTELQMHRKFIASFDFKTESYSLMECPDYSDKLGASLDMGKISGCLCLMFMGRTILPFHEIGFRMDSAELWVMKEYGKRESWVRVFSIPETAASVGMYLHARPLAYSKDGRKVLIEYDYLGIGWLDLETQRFVMFEGVPKPPIFSRVFQGSLVSVGDDKLKFEEGTISASMSRKNTKTVVFSVYAWTKMVIQCLR